MYSILRHLFLYPRFPMRTLAIACALFLLAAPRPAAQEAGLPATRVNHEQELLSEPARRALQQARAREAGALRWLAYGATGGLVGAGVGLLVSQVIYSDWDKVTNSTFASERFSYAMGGSGVGALTGLFMAARAPGSAPGGDAGMPRVRQSSGDDMIRSHEILEVRGTTALDLVRSLRPNWLVGRGVQRLRQGGQVTATAERGNLHVAAGEIAILVYLDHARMGGVETLQQIPASAVRAMHWLDAAAATHRWGAGHTHGVILVESVGQAGETAAP